MRRLASFAVCAALVAAAVPSVAADPDPSEPYQRLQWGLGLVHAPEAWSIATGEGVVVAVVDEGVDDDHPELDGKLTEGASWWGCEFGTPPPCHDPDAWDAAAHGTHMAGIIAAPRDGVGIAGVAPDSRIMPVRTISQGSVLPNLNPQDSLLSLYYTPLGIIWAVDNGADVINLSLGSLAFGAHVATSHAYGWSVAMEYAAAHDVLVVAAASNDGFPTCDNGFMGATGNVLCVGGVDPDDQRSGFANYGAGLDVVAPAGEASGCSDRLPLSIYPVDRTHLCPVGSGVRGYEYWGGTSQATAFVSGVAALLAEQGIRGAAAAELIKRTSDDLGPAGWDLDFGHGRVNALRAVTRDLNPGLPIPKER